MPQKKISRTKKKKSRKAKNMKFFSKTKKKKTRKACPKKKKKPNLNNEVVD